MTPPDVDPRVERSRAVILEATLDELVAVGYGTLTVEGVARRAGVGKATIYRHWDGKLELVADAIAKLKQMVPLPETHDHRARITAILHSLAELLAAGSRFGACIPEVIAASERDEAVREFHHTTGAQRRAFMIGMLDAARDAGHLSHDVDTALLTELLVAPIFFRRLMSPRPFPPADVDKLIATVLDPYWI